MPGIKCYSLIMANAINTAADKMTFDAASEQAFVQLAKVHGKRAARLELDALVDTAIAQRSDRRSARDLSIEFGVDQFLVEVIQAQ
jgi:hypothetical protein